MKYYHASRSVFKPGDIIAPNPFVQHLNGRGIYVTLSPCVHYTLWLCGDLSIKKVRYNVYQVRPLQAKTKVYYGVWEELIIAGPVEVLKCLGEANKNRRVSSVLRNRKGFRVKEEKLKPHEAP